MNDRTRGIDRRDDRWPCEFGPGLLLHVNRSGEFAVAECQVGTKLVGKRAHGVVLSASRNPQEAIALGARFFDQFAEQKTSNPLAAQLASTLKAISGSKSGEVSGG